MKRPHNTRSFRTLQRRIAHNKTFLKDYEEKTLVVEKIRVVEKTRIVERDRVLKKPIEMPHFQQRHSHQLRRAVLDSLGGKCVACGYDADWRALQIDHILGGGGRDRKKYKDVKAYYEHIIEDDTGYQLLCANCNWIKKYENHEDASGLWYHYDGEKIEEWPKGPEDITGVH